MKNQDYIAIINRIYESGYFTNHGPQVRELEDALQDFFAVKNAIVVGNESLAIVMALSGMNITNEVVAFDFFHTALIDAAGWSGLDIEQSEADIAEAFRRHPEKKIGALLAYDLWKKMPDVSILRMIEGATIPIIAYQKYCDIRNIKYCNSADFSNIVTVVELGSSQAISSNCACILVNNDHLAELYRNIRSSYGMRKLAEVNATANGRVSEFQAGIAIKNLQQVMRS